MLHNAVVALLGVLLNTWLHNKAGFPGYQLHARHCPVSLSGKVSKLSHGHKTSYVAHEKKEPNCPN